ncbi:hypothetical protein RQN30_02545 [Arcanobacterium hippocoleae]
MREPKQPRKPHPRRLEQSVEISPEEFSAGGEISARRFFPHSEDSVPTAEFSGSQRSLKADESAALTAGTADLAADSDQPKPGHTFWRSFGR